ncbi:cyanophycinase [Undibacterium flavidum]|uniref:Cyanophycinase n=1 Tax=Undibacterium flavidum TaxID=2762297 RepID=A0ABR6YD57_9BURK|nr:cyanophycinase [Undibacterium flavidum]MBC3874481.1 cyanophycinase [Undibacterium flavidum]
MTHYSTTSFSRFTSQIHRPLYRRLSIFSHLRLLCLLIFSLLLLSLSLLSAHSQASTDLSKVRGSLLIIGGALRNDNAVVWEKLIDQAGGKNSKIAIIPAASGNPDRAADFVVQTLKKYGANAFIVPLSAKYETKDGQKKTSQINQDRYWITQIEQADGVYFTGGDQAKITRALVNEDGKPSAMLNAIWSLYQRGGVIAGTSAGAAIMSGTMFSNAKSVLTTLKLGVTEGDEIAPGLGFIGNDIFIDQHLIIRGRFARMLPLMLKKNYRLGFGIDENTALLVRPERDVEIIGYKGAILLDFNALKTNAALPEFNLQHASISYLSHGDRFEFQSQKIIPASDKSLITNTESEDSDQAPAFYPNILGNTTVVELMSGLAESSRHSALGLAFDAYSKVKPDLGFEFTFSKTPETKAYFSSSTGAEAFTVMRLRLDVRPVKMAQPLYEPIK